MKKDLQALFNEYMYECEFVQHLSPKTMKDYRDAFRLLVKLQPDVSIENLSSQTMVSLFKQLQERRRKVGKSMVTRGITKSTIITYWNRYNRFFSVLEQNGNIESNPFKGLKRPHQVQDSKKYLEKEQTEKVLTAILTSANDTFLMKRNLVIFYLFLFCGLRRAELLQLQIRDIDLPKKILTVRASTSKVERSRQIPLHSYIIIHLLEYLTARKQYTTQYLIVSRYKDAQLSQAGLKHLVQLLCQTSGVNFHVHQLRHTFAVNFLNSSKDLAKLQQLLGHASPSMTLHYTMCLPPQTMRPDIENLSIDGLI